MWHSMFSVFDDDQLALLQCQILGMIGQSRQLAQAKRRERGAYVRPALSGPTDRFEQALLRSYETLFTEIVASLRGANDDVTSGRLHQALDRPVTEPEIVEAMDEWSVPEDEKEHPIDRTKLAAILALILLWRSRHTKRAETYLTSFFEQGRQDVLKEIGVETVASPTAVALKGTILGRYAGDLDRLEQALREGSPRSHGIEWIVEHAASLGEALALLKRLQESERLRIELFAESLAWTAWSEGFRAGAVEGTIVKAKELGFVTVDGLSVASLTEAQQQLLPHFIWMGPDDERCCAPCRAQFQRDVVALDLSDLPAPQDICAYHRACRHWWELST
jgi:hypothetical protein